MIEFIFRDFMTTIEIKEDLDDPKERARWVDKNAKKGQKNIILYDFKVFVNVKESQSQEKTKGS